MTNNSLFYLVFFSQIMLISYYYPKQILQRVTYVFKNYPASQYPRLYNKIPEYLESGARKYKVLNQIILIIGFILMGVTGYWDDTSEGNVSELIPLAYGMLQFIPLALMELSGFAYFKLMRATNKQTRRSATLIPRRLFDFISSKIFALAVFSNVACLFFFFYLDNFHFAVANDTFVIAITLIASNLLYALIIRFNIKGSKLDPYQATEDRIKQITTTVRSIIFISIVASLFLMLSEAIDRSELDYLESPFMSLYLQLIVFAGLGSLLRKIRVEDINFDVYKKDESTI